jgi:hypothetical protein
MNDRAHQHHAAGDQKLALAVILQAIGDACNPRISFRTRTDAAEFLAGQRSTVWLRMAGISPEAVQGLAGHSFRFLLKSKNVRTQSFATGLAT